MSVRVALRLKRYGITRVRPLVGGQAAWVENGFPVELTNAGNTACSQG